MTPRHLDLQVSPHIAALLQRVMENGHVLTEPEMVQLFATRGADFDVSVALQLTCSSGCTVMLKSHCLDLQFIAASCSTML